MKEGDVWYFRNPTTGNMEILSAPQPSAWDMQIERLGSTMSTAASQPIVVGEDLSLKSDIETLQNQMKTVQDSLSKFFSVQTVPLQTLGNSEWELKQALFVAVEQRGADNFVACLYDVDLYGYGETIPEAIDDLKMIILDQFEYLLERQRTIRLGSIPRRQLEFLKSILVSTNA